MKKEMTKAKPIFHIPEATTEDIIKIIKSLNPNKVTGPDQILIKIIKISRNINF